MSASLTKSFVSFNKYFVLVLIYVGNMHNAVMEIEGSNKMRDNVSKTHGINIKSL